MLRCRRSAKDAGLLAVLDVIIGVAFRVGFLRMRLPW